MLLLLSLLLLLSVKMDVENIDGTVLVVRGDISEIMRDEVDTDNGLDVWSQLVVESLAASGSDDGVKKVVLEKVDKVLLACDSEDGVVITKWLVVPKSDGEGI